MATPLFEADFSGANAAAVKAAIAAQSGVYSIPDGDILIGGAPSGNNAVKISGASYLRYPTSGNFNAQKGAVTCWLRCEDDLRVRPLLNRSIFRFNWNTGRECLFYFIQQPLLCFKYFYNVHSTAAYSDDYSWAPQSWHFVKFVWDFSNVTAANNYVAIQVDDHIADPEVVWDQYDPGTVDGGATLELGYAGGDNVFNGYFADIKIYGTDIDSTILYTIPPHRIFWYDNWFNPHDDGSSEVAFRAHFPDNKLFAGNWETHNDKPGFTGSGRPNDCPLLSALVEPDADLIFFNRPAIQTVWPNYVPTQADIDDSNNLAGAYTWQAAKGQVLPIFFNTYSRLNLTNVQVHFSAFAGPGSDITDAKIYIVDNWWQAGSSFGTVPEAYPSFNAEMFLQNDRINGDNPPAAGRFDANDNINQFVAPYFPVQDHVDTVLNAAESRQFCIIVKVPAAQAAGTYTSTITLSATGLANQTKIITLEVLPFALRSSVPQMGIPKPLAQAWICEGNGTPAINELWPMVVNHFTMLKEAGINILIIPNDFRADGIYTWGFGPAGWDTYSYCTEYGFGDYVGNDTFEKLMHNLCACAKKAGIEDVVAWVPIGHAAESRGGYSLTISEADVKKAVEVMQLYGFTGYIWGRDEFGAGWCNTVNNHNGTGTMTWTGGAQNFYSQPESRQTDSVWIENLVGGGGVLYAVTAQDGLNFTITPEPPDQTGAWWVTGDQYLYAKWAYEAGGQLSACISNIHTVYRDYAERFPTGSPYGIDLYVGYMVDQYFYDVMNGLDQVDLPNKQTWYYQCRSTRWPETLRFYSGYMAYLTGIGVCPTFLDAAQGHISASYDFPSRMSGFIYQSTSGPIPTMQLQAHRMGVDDDKLLKTFDYYKNAATISHPNEAAASQAVIDAILDTYREDYWGTSVRVTNQGYADNRVAIIAEIQTLMGLTNRTRLNGAIIGKIDGQFVEAVDGVPC